MKLSIDSISIIFQDLEWPEFLSAVPSGIEGHLETPSDTASFVSPTSSALQSHKWPSNAKARQGGKPPDNASSNNTSVPHRIKVYGLHLNASTEKKSVATTDLKDSVNTVTQSHEIKSATKQSSSPSDAPKYIFYILVILIALWALHKLRS